MVEVRYHTDPACPWSWGLEPVVRRLVLRFGGQLRWSLVMGGLERDLLQGRTGPATRLEPATHLRLVGEWLRVSAETEAPLDPLLWFEGPLHSTYPACMAVEAATEQGEDAAFHYLRRLREGIMCARRKLDHAEALIEEARGAGLDVERFRSALRSHAITEMLGADLEATAAIAADGDRKKEDGIRASRGYGGAPLPTLLFRGEGGAEHAVRGFQAGPVYEAAAEAAGARPGSTPPPSPEEAVARFGSVTTREVEVLCELPGPRAAAALFGLAEEWRLQPRRCLTGHLWERA